MGKVNLNGCQRASNTPCTYVCVLDLQVIKAKLLQMAGHAEALRAANQHLWLDDREATTIRQELLPQAEAHVAHLSRTLGSAITLRSAVEAALHTQTVSKLQLVQV